MTSSVSLSPAGMTCSELHRLYFEMKDRVFLKPTFGLACNTPELETILRERFHDKRMSDVEKPKSVCSTHTCAFMCVIVGILSFLSYLYS